MPSPLHQHEHMWTGTTERGLRSRCGLCRPAHVHGGHDRVVPYDPDFLIAITRSVSIATNFVFTPNLPTSGRLGARTFLIPLRLRVASPAVSSRGRTVFVSLPASIVRHKSMSALRCQSGFSKQPADFTLMRSGQIRQDIADALHHHVSAPSSALFASSRKHAVKGFGRVSNPYRALNKSEGEFPNVGR